MLKPTFGLKNNEIEVVNRSQYVEKYEGFMKKGK